MSRNSDSDDQSDQSDTRNNTDLPSPSKPQTHGRKRGRFAVHISPDAPMAEFIRLWEKLTGRVFDGDPVTGLPWGMTEEDDENLDERP